MRAARGQLASFVEFYAASAHIDFQRGRAEDGIAEDAGYLHTFDLTDAAEIEGNRGAVHERVPADFEEERSDPRGSGEHTLCALKVDGLALPHADGKYLAVNGGEGGPGIDEEKSRLAAFEPRIDEEEVA